MKTDDVIAQAKKTNLKGDVRMRLIKINLLALGLVLLSVSVASAITIRLENTGNPNQVSVFLDMDAEAGTPVSQINIGLDSLDSEIAYAGAEPAPLLPINQPGIMLSATFAWLAPTVAYGQESVALDVPAGKTRALTAFFQTSAATDGANSGNQNVLMATFNYDAPVFAEYFDLQFGADGGFFVALSAGGTENVAGQVNLVNNLASIPEPTTAMLVGLGLVGLGVAGRRKA